MAAKIPDARSLYAEQKVRAGGGKDYFILGSIGEVSDPDVIPMEKVPLTEENQRRLANQGIPSYCVDDLSILKARIGLDNDFGKGKKFELVGVEVSEPGRELTRDHVLKKLENVFTNCKRSGVTICYFGHGKKNTGDWCFQDGFITFKDITELYTNHLHGRVLMIVSDCSHSGQWVKDCLQYLEEVGVRPCAHSAVEKGVFLKVFASCRPEERAATPCYSVRGTDNDKNTKAFLGFRFDETGINKASELRQNQHYYGVDFTTLRCKKKIDDPCGLSPDYTWHKWNESDRVYLVRGKDRGRPAWHYVLLVDDEETRKKFREQVASGTVDIADYGQVLKSGWGEDPPNEVRDMMERNYNIVYK